MLINTAGQTPFDRIRDAREGALITLTAEMAELAQLPLSAATNERLSLLASQVQHVAEKPLPGEFEEFEQAHDEMNEYLARPGP